MAMEVLEEEKLIEKSELLGKYFKEQLESLLDMTSGIKEVRGKGLFIAIEFEKNFPVTAKELSKLLMKRGLLAKETHEFSIRFAPPLTITKKEITWAFEIIKDVILNSAN